jgi:hypothetical protein
MSPSLSRVRDQVIASRRDQGLPDTVTDDRLLQELTAEVVQGGDR